MADKRTNSRQLILRPHPSITAEQARASRAQAWAFIFRCHETRKNPAASQGGRGDYDGPKAEECSADESILPD
jgi:hypothetical protein